MFPTEGAPENLHSTSRGDLSQIDDASLAAVRGPATRPSVFSSISRAAGDQILDLKQLFLRDPRAEKVDLSAGVYHDGTGANTTMAVVVKAEQALAARAASATSRSADYVPIEGLPEFNERISALLFRGTSALAENRVATLQAVGGTSALRYAADFLHRFFPESRVFLSDPSWPNHKTIFQHSGFNVESYPYYDPGLRQIDFESMEKKLVSIPAGSIVLIQGCCHNPSGADISSEQWDKLVAIFASSDLVPIVDLAYHGFGSGVDSDVEPIRKLAEAKVSHFVACSFSKNFSLYNRRIGSLTFVGRDAGETANVLSQIRVDIRANNSNPPRDGAEIVAEILGSPSLRREWESELVTMRERIAEIRGRFVSEMEARGCQELSHMREERGMFSLTGLGASDIGKLREQHGIYMLENGRICFACLNDGNLARVCDALAGVLVKAN